jgi:hypothetical protein
MINIKKSPYPYYQSNNPLLQDHTNDLKIFEDKPFWCNNPEQNFVQGDKG